MMAKPISASAKRKGRPVTTGTGTTIGVRMLNAPLAALDSWIDKQKEPDLSRPEAIRRLVVLGLTVKAKARSTGRRPRAALVADLAADTIDSLPSKPIAKPGHRSRAQELARDAIEKMGDPTASPEERDQRRRRLTKGPIEFRAARVDQLKAKRK